MRQIAVPEDMVDESNDRTPRIRVFWVQTFIERHRDCGGTLWPLAAFRKANGRCTLKTEHFKPGTAQGAADVQRIGEGNAVLGKGGSYE